jgi:hypothetical protein
MKKRDIYFAAIILVLVAVLYVLSISGKKPPAIPPDTVHVAAATKEDCLGCHAEGKSSPLRKEHPPKDQCFECHKMKATGHGVMR